jgi:hypothetical protein
MSSAPSSRPVQLIGGCSVAFLAACFAIFALNLFTPPRSIAELLPTPTATHRPPPTITPVAYPPTPPLAVKNNFALKDNFPRATGVQVPFGYKDDYFYLTPPLDPGYAYVLDQNFQDPGYLNLSLNATAAPAPDSPTVEYGVLFWHTEDDQGQESFLAFTINSGSEFRLRAYQPVTDTTTSATTYKWADIIALTQSPDIHVDGTPNQLRVDVHPRRLLAYINDQLVIDTDAKLITDLRLSRDFDGRVGVIALTQDAGAEARFTQFDIYADVKHP